MKYVAISERNRDSEMQGYNLDKTVFVVGYGGLMKNAIFNLKILIRDKTAEGIQCFNIKEQSFETDEPPHKEDSHIPIFYGH